MAELKIVGWTDFDSDYPSVRLSNEEMAKVFELIQQEIMDNNYIFSGEEHQNSLTGVPVFSDGTCFRASMRSWGKIMASIYSGPNGEELTYMDFYMSLGSESKMPEYKELDVEPLEVENQTIGCFTREDSQIVAESVAMGMSFMTTDKVLELLYEFMKQDAEEED